MMGTSGPLPKQGEKMDRQTNTKHFHMDRYGIVQDQTPNSLDDEVETKEKKLHAHVHHFF